MTQETVKLWIPFEALVHSVRELSLKDKRRLWELLDEQMAQAEEEVWERDQAVQAEIQEARAAYQAGDYLTIIESLLSSLPHDERAAIISYGIAIRLSDLRKRLFLAESKVEHFERKFQTTLAELDAEGLPDDADYEMHENYILWHHWAEVIGKTRKALASLEEIASSGLCLGEVIHASGS